MAVAIYLVGNCFGPRRELEDGPRESGRIGAIEGDRVETLGTQVIEPRCPLEENDGSPFLRLRQPALASPPELLLERFWKQ